MDELPRGSGPWFVALLWNTSKSGKKQTEVVIHTYPHLFIHAYNSKDVSSFWVVLMKVGPFEQWSKATVFSTQWSQKLRTCTARIEKGITLCTESHDPLTLWIQTKDKETIKREYCMKKKSDGLQIYALRQLVSNK